MLTLRVSAAKQRVEGRGGLSKNTTCTSVSEQAINVLGYETPPVRLGDLRPLSPERGAADRQHQMHPHRAVPPVNGVKATRPTHARRTLARWQSTPTNERPASAFIHRLLRDTRTQTWLAWQQANRTFVTPDVRPSVA